MVRGTATGVKLKGSGEWALACAEKSSPSAWL
jgi:hypothetical protein